MFFKKQPTVKGKEGFGDAQAEESAKSFNKAMKGIGTDEKRIIREIIEHTNAQRQLIKQKYQIMYGHSLEQDLKSELSGNFEDVVIALLEPSIEYEARCLRDAIHGIGTNERVVIDVLCSKKPEKIEQLKKTYAEKYHSDLEKDIKNEEQGPLGRVFRSLASAARPGGDDVDIGLAKQEAQKLYDAGEGTFGTDEVEFVRILCSRSYAQLRATFNEYANVSGGREIEQSIQRETSGDLGDALLAIVKCVRNSSAFFAERLHESMKGVGTKDKDLIRIMVSRSEVDMDEIRRQYKRLYDRDLVKDIKSELSGDYEDIIVALVGKD